MLIANAVSVLNDAERRLEKAKDSIPSYTGQWEDIDYYAGAQEDYNRAAEAYEDAVRAACGLPPLPVDDSPSEFQVSMSRKIEDAFPIITPAERRYLDSKEVVYLGDLIAALDASPSFNNKITLPNCRVINEIPHRLGTEVWVRPA
jgi:hypothetical protein